MDKEKDDLVRIFRSYITVKGRRIYARQRGKKAFPILVPCELRMKKDG